MKLITTVKLCDVTVPVFAETVDVGHTVAGNLSPLSARLLYRWEVHEAESISCVYVGKATNGNDRPTKTYPVVVADLRQSRGTRTLCRDPIKPYFLRSPWGFRWIHHQLEAASYRMRDGNKKNERIQLILFGLGNSTGQDLHRREQLEIARAKLKYPSSVLANGKPCIALQSRANLDRIWTCLHNEA